MVAELVLDVARVAPQSDQNARERVSQLVRRDASRQRLHIVYHEHLVGPARDRRDDPHPEVVLVALGALRGREHDVVGPRVPSVGLPREQLVAQARQQVDLPVARLRLRAPDGDPPGGEVDVSPQQVASLAGPQAGEHERRDEGAAPDRLATARRMRLEVARGGEQRSDVLGAVEMHWSPALDPELALADAHGVAGDQLVFLGTGEDLPEPHEVLVDGLARQAAGLQIEPHFGELVRLVAVDLLHRDLRESVPTEERQQVPAQLVQIRVPRAG